MADRAARETRIWRYVLRAFREEWPTRSPVVVSRLPFSPDVLGDCCRIRGKYRIRVNTGIDLTGQLYTLAHEWAHAVAWPAEAKGERWEEHSPLMVALIGPTQMTMFAAWQEIENKLAGEAA